MESALILVASGEANRFLGGADDRDLVGGIGELRLTGGGTRSVLFNQIQADVQGRPLTLLQNKECTVLGAAILGAVGSGYFANLSEAVSAMVHIATIIEPRVNVRTLYDELFGVFTDAYVTLAESSWYERLYKIQARHF